MAPPTETPDAGTTTPPPQSPEDKNLEDTGQRLNIEPRLIERAKVIIREQTRARLRGLLKETAEYKKLSPKEQADVNRLLVAASRGRFSEDLLKEIKNQGYLFDGAFGEKKPNEEDKVENNPTYQRLYQRLKETFIDPISPDAPVDDMEEWIKYLRRGVYERIKAYKEQKRKFKEDDVEKLIAEFKDFSKSGVGTFEDWFKSRHPEKHKAWKEALGELEQDRKSLETKRAELQAKLTEAKKKIPAGPSDERLREEAQRIEDQIKQAKSEKELKSLEEPIETFNGNFAKRQALKDKLEEEKRKIPQDIAEFPGIKQALADVTDTIDRTISGDELNAAETKIIGEEFGFGKFVENARKLKQRFDELKAKESQYTTLYPKIAENLRDAEEKMKEASSEQAVKDCETNLSTIESKLRALDQIKPLLEITEIPESTRAGIKTKLAKGEIEPEQALTELREAQQKEQQAAASEETGEAQPSWLEQFFAGSANEKTKTRVRQIITRLLKLASLPIIGSLVKPLLQSMGSNKFFAEEFKDPGAKLAWETEKQFRRFGLPDALAAELGDKSTKEAIKILGQKIAAIDAKAETDKNDDDRTQRPRLVQLMNQLKKKGGEKADKPLNEFMGDPNWPAGVEYEAGTAPAAAAPTQAAAPPAAPSSAEPQAQSIETQYADKIKTFLTANQGKKPISDTGLKFAGVPYKAGSEIKTLNLTMTQDGKLKLELEGTPPTIYTYAIKGILAENHILKEITLPAPDKTNENITAVAGLKNIGSSDKTSPVLPFDKFLEAIGQIAQGQTPGTIAGSSIQLEKIS